MLASHRLPKLVKSLFLAFSFIASLPSMALAQDTSLGPPTLTLKPVVGFSSINQAVSTLTSFAFLGAGVLAFAYILRGAFKYLTAGDNAANVTAARQTMLNAIIGLIIVSMAYVIFRVVVGVVPGLSDFFS